MTVRSRIRPTAMPQNQPLPEGLQVIADGTGGLDLFADGFEVETNRSFDMVNYDPLPQGGWRMRDTIAPFSPTDLVAPPGALTFYEGVSSWLIASVRGKVYACPGYGQAFVDQGITASHSIPTPLYETWKMAYQWRCTQANGYGYLQNGYDAPRRWFPGSPTVTLTQSWNEDLSTPTQGNMPIGRYCVMHRGHFWIGFTRESGTEYPDRLRFSHPVINGLGQESWRAADYFEVDQGADGQYITALRPAGTELWVFKHHSVYRVDGVDTSTFALEPASRDVGAAGPNAVAVQGNKAWFWDAHAGLHVLDMASQGIRYGVSLHRVPGPADRLFRDHEIQEGLGYQVQVGCVGARVWVNLPMADNTRRLFVFDPTVGQGAWTEYDLNLGMFHDWSPFTDEAMPVATHLRDDLWGRVLRLDVQGDVDDYGGGVEENVATRVVTTWASAQQPLVTKHWQSLEAVVEGDQTLNVKLYTDWSPDAVQTSALAVPDRQAELVVGESPLPEVPKEIRRPGGTEESIPCLDVDGFPGGLTAHSDRPRVRTRRVYLSVPLSRVIQVRLSGGLPSKRHTIRGIGLRWRQSLRRFP